MRKGFAFLLVVCLLLGVAPAAYAGDTEADHDGYIICLKEETSSEGIDLPEGVEEIYAPEGLYKVDDPDLVAELEEKGLLEYAEPNLYVELDGDSGETAYSSDLWHLNMIGLRYAEENNITGKTASGEAIKVGILDSGLYAEHEAFRNVKIGKGINFCDDQDRGDTTDSYGHGSFVAGIIAASLNESGEGTQGIAPDVELIPFRCFDDKNGTIANVTAAIYAAVDTYQCQVLNMSFGATEAIIQKVEQSDPEDSLTLRGAVAYAAEEGVIMAASVGNHTSGSKSTGNDPLLYPAAYDEVIGVGAVNKSGAVSTVSYQNESVFVTAPGEYVYGVKISSTTAYNTGSGTSYSAPMVTAAAALALSVDPTLTREEFMTLLADTAEDLGDEGKDNAYGYGLLRVDRLLQTMLEGWCVTGTAETGFTASVWGKGIREREAVYVAEAAYDDTGRMLGFQVLETIPVENESISLRNLTISPIQNAAAIKLLLLQEGSWAPAGKCWGF